VPDPYIRLRRYLRHEGIHQGSFAYPGLACDEAHLPLSLPGGGVPLV
jgi:hypothetical protein